MCQGTCTKAEFCFFSWLFACSRLAICFYFFDMQITELWHVIIVLMIQWPYIYRR
jgi:hypothetical protein